MRSLSVFLGAIKHPQRGGLWQPHFPEVAALRQVRGFLKQTLCQLWESKWVSKCLVTRQDLAGFSVTRFIITSYPQASGRQTRKVIDIIFKIPIISFVKCLPIQPLPRTECNQHMHSMGDKHFDQASEFRAICIFLYITVYVFQIIYLQNLLLLIMGGRELFKILRHLFIA